MNDSARPFLLGGVAATAIIVGALGAAPASAQCVTNGSTVTCGGATTDTQAQQAVNAATPPNLTLNVNQGAVIATAQRRIEIRSPGNPTFSGSIIVDNAGRIGTSSALTTDLIVSGPGRFTGVNSGTISGSVTIGALSGGASGAGTGSFTNSGLVTGSVVLQGDGDLRYSGSGAIQGSNGLSLTSRVGNITAGADGTQTTVTGGRADAVVDGIVRSPNVQPGFRPVSVIGITGATASIGGETGSVSVRSADANTAFRNVFQNGSSSNTNNSVAVGGAAAFTLAPAARVNGEVTVAGLTSANAAVDGAIVPPGQVFGAIVSVTANASNSRFSDSSTFSGTGQTFTSSFQSASGTTSRGGTASLTVGAQGNIAGGAAVTGGSSATAQVAGVIGSTAAFSNTLSVRAGAADTTFTSASRSDALGGSSNSSSMTTQRGGDASVTVSGTGAVLGAVQVNGISNAAVTIAGSVGTPQNRSGVSAVVQGADVMSSSTSVNDAAGSNRTSTDTQVSRAGTASAVIAATGRVAGGVSVFGGTSATATIDGAVNTSAQSFNGVSVATGGADGTNTTTTTSTTAGGGAFTQTQEGVSTARGGAASVTVGETGSVVGSVTASSTRATATATLAGRAGIANPQNFSPSPSLSAIANGFDTRASSTSAPNRNAFSVADTVVGGQATATVLATGVMSGDVVARGDAGAKIGNAGMVVGALRLTAGAANTTRSSDSTGAVTTTNGITTSTNRSLSTNSATPVIVDGTVTNTGSAAGVTATATGTLLFRNEGTVTGSIALAASPSATSSSDTLERVATFAPLATGGGGTTVETRTTLSESTPPTAGGVVVGTYNGTVGAIPTAPRQTQTAITQTANRESTATLSGTILANVTSTTGGTATSSSSISTTTSTTQPALTGTPAATSTTVTSSRSSSSISGSANSVTVLGAVRDDGTGTGNVTAQAATGAASALVSGGTVEGVLTVSGGLGQNVTSSSDRTVTSARAASNGFASFIEQSSTTTTTTITRLAGGTAAATLTGGTVGSTRVSGLGTGAGSAAAMASVDVASAVGAITVAAGGMDRRDDQTSTFANGIRTIEATRLDTVSTLAGNARADIAGRATGAVTLTSVGGAATLNLTGVAADAIVVAANISDRSMTTTATFAVTNLQGFLVSRQTGQTTTTTTTARGGVATVAIASSSALQAAGNNAVGGAITVNGFAGSVLTVAAGSRVLTNNGGSVRALGTATNTTTVTTSSYDPNTGAFTGSTARQTVTPVAGPASITNAGVIGAATGYFSAPVSVRAESVGGASIANAGQIFGDVAAGGFGERRDIVSVLTPVSANAPQTAVTTTTYTPVAGTARIANTGVISGRAEVSGGTGAVANTGVIRGAVQLGASLRNYTNTVTSTTARQPDGTLPTTSVTSPATAPSALFAQTFTLDQNGLLLGGVRVEGATTADPVTNAPIRTSTIAATVNLNQGSITLGDVTGQRDASGRLTRTAVNLTGDGFLGAGPNLQAVQSAGGVRYSAAPNYAAFAGIDFALGTSGTGGFAPAVALTSGSRIAGVDSVTKSGSGVFTIVGAPLLRETGSVTYTIDAPLLRVAGGELQLGVAAASSAAAAGGIGTRAVVPGVFAVNGSVQNDATLVVGRRITNGTLSGVEGITLSTTGNFTQSASGTLVLAAAPTPALQTAPSLVTTPSFLSVDGALSLAGTIAVAAPQGIFVSGRGPDFASVGGAFTSTASVSAFGSPFVTFGLATRSEGGRTLVAVNVTRTPFASVATNRNAFAAAGALQATIPAAVAAGGGSDPATVILGLDTGGAARAARTLDELGQASFYGSLAAISITRPFGEVSDALASIDAEPDRPVSLFLRMGAAGSRTRGDAATGARQLTSNGYGSVFGLSTTGRGISAGIGVGPGWTDAGAGIGRGRANGWMVGSYLAGRFGVVSLAGQAVAGWSDWTASRRLPSFGRFATTQFDQREIRINGRVALDLSLGSIGFAPFAGVEWRQWRFDGFTERDGGVLGVRSGRRIDSVVSPEAGVRVTGTSGRLRAFAEGAYVFQQDVPTARNFALAGTSAGFTAQGVAPDDFARFGGGLEGDIGRGTVFVSSDVGTGGGNRLGSVRVGARVRF